MFWFEGRMLRDGSDACAGSGGGGIWWEERREALCGYGDAGTELRSGMVGGCIEDDGGDGCGERGCYRSYLEVDARTKKLLFPCVKYPTMVV